MAEADPTPPTPDQNLASLPAPSAFAAGWYRDPWHPQNWRWHDGHGWTAHSSRPQETKPRLPDWLSLPVILGSLLAVPTIVVVAFLSPVAVLLGLVPIAIVFPSLVWLDRVEPEPQGARIHAMLWGAAVAGSISGIVNSLVALASSPEVAAVVSAPLVEEATKAAGIAWALRRGYVDGTIDGIVYAGWVGLGFAVVEDMLYFVEASANGTLAQIFVIRAILTPFAHPLFTIWTGLGIGWAVYHKKSVWVFGALGYVIAAGLHMMWNGSLVRSEASGSGELLVVVAVLFVGLFGTCVAALIVARRRQLKRFASSVPHLAAYYQIPANELAVFTHPRVLLGTRRRLSRRQRRHFDSLHAALARLALFDRAPGAVNQEDQSRLLDQVHHSRAVMSAAMKG